MNKGRDVLTACVLVICFAGFIRIGGQNTYEPDQKKRAQLKPLVDGLLPAWNKYSIVCLGEDHGSRNDSDLRISLVLEPAFARQIKLVIVEFADVRQQSMLDQFELDLKELSRTQLSVVWNQADGHEVWDAPIYEAFLRAIQRSNLALPRDQRVRVIAGDDPTIPNRGRWIREAVDREILSQGKKALAIYGAGHCENRGGGFPGELSEKYPDKIWSAFSFYNPEEGRRVLGLGDRPALIPITGTEKASLASGKMFYLGRMNDTSKLGDFANAVVYYGNLVDTKVPAAKP